MASENETPNENNPENTQVKPATSQKVEAPTGDFFFGGSKQGTPAIDEETTGAATGGDIFIGSNKPRKSRLRKTTTEMTAVIGSEETTPQPEVPALATQEPILQSTQTGEVTLGDKVLPLAQTLLYLLLGVACIGPIKAMKEGKPATEQLPLLLLYPFLILLHHKLIEKIESEFANGRDYLMGGIVILFASVIVLTISVVVPMHILMRPVGVLSALGHMMYAVSVLQRIK